MTRNKVRRAFIIGGDDDRPWKTVRRVLAGSDAADVIVVATENIAGFSVADPTRAKALLGREFDAVVFDARADLDADALGGISGTVRGGGSLMIVVPSGACIESGSSHFLRRLVRTARAAPGVICFFEHDDLPRVIPPAPSATSSHPHSDGETADQRRAIEAVHRVALGHRRRPAVLLADRGRGKSAALGIAAAELLQRGQSRIVVTAPRPQAVDVLFRHLRRVLNAPEGSSEVRVVRVNDGECRFVPPDELLRNPVEADLVLVDEAAGIPVAMLAALLRRYARIAFATTVHGYEGSGRGFVLHFNRVLDQLAPGWRQETLSTPMRWAADDPLEQWINDALLLNAEYAALEAPNLPISVERFERSHLAEREEILKPLVGLLVQAHYRTTPDDLRRMLDDERIDVWGARDAQARVVGATLAAREGPLDTNVADAVREGRRRVHGQLLPQSLLFHCGIVEAGALSFKRIVRIAVHPQCRRQHIGRSLVERLANEAAVEAVDVIGASFAADADSIAFWRACGCMPARLGITADHASGLRSLIVLRGVSEAGRRFASEAQRRFAATFLHGLADQWRDVDSALVMTLLGFMPAGVSGVDDQHQEQLNAFASAQGHYDPCAAALWQLCATHLAGAFNDGALDAEHAQALVCKVLQKHRWTALAERLGVSGKREAEQRVREAAAVLLRYAVRQSDHEESR